MATISAAEMIRRLERVKSLLPQETERLFLRNPQIIRAKVDEFRRGQTPDGGRIGYYASPAYRLFKQSLNPLASGTVDLILSGNFTRGIGLEKRGQGYIFDSSDEKAPELFEKYGDENRLLNQQTWERLQKEAIAPQLVAWMKRQLNQ